MEVDILSYLLLDVVNMSYLPIFFIHIQIGLRTQTISYKEN